MLELMFGRGKVEGGGASEGVESRSLMLRCLPFMFGRVEVWEGRGECGGCCRGRGEGGGCCKGGVRRGVGAIVTICWLAGDGALGSSGAAGVGADICSWFLAILRAIVGLLIFNSLKSIPPGQ